MLITKYYKPIASHCYISMSLARLPGEVLSHQTQRTRTVSTPAIGLRCDPWAAFAPSSTAVLELLGMSTPQRASKSQRVAAS